MQVHRDRHGHLHVHAFRDDENGDHNIACRGVRAHWLSVRNRLTTSMPAECTTGVAFDPLQAYAASFDPGDLGDADSTVPRGPTGLRGSTLAAFVAAVMGPTLRLTHCVCA